MDTPQLSTDMGLSVATLNGGAVAIDPKEIVALAGRLRGPLLQSGAEGYDEARSLWNGMIDKRPALIARCAGAADVIDAVHFAREHNLLVSVRGGGHNVAGTAVCDGALMIDLSTMRGVWVDPAAHEAVAQPGVDWGDVDRETQVFGLAVPGGVVSTTGISGLTLGGGFGWLSRKHGLTSDSLLAVDVVTANGEFVTASESEHPELFWGMRGGGGNFGIATSFRYRLHPIGPTVMGGMTLYPMEKAPEVLRFYRDYAASAPDALGTLAVLRMAPPAPFLPKELHGKPVVGIVAFYAGSVKEGEEAVQPVKAYDQPLADTIAPKPYRAIQTMFDAAAPHGRHYYWKSGYLSGLSDAAISTAVSYASRMTSPLSAVLLFQLGGAIKHVAEDSSAAAHRDAEFVLNIQSSWVEPQESPRHVQWTREFWQAMRPFGTGGVYVNFLTEDEGQERVRSAYGANYERLRALKERYDPTNFFRTNQNIKP